MIALLLSIVLWHPGLHLFVCNPGKTPAAAPSNCERVQTKPLWILPLP